MFIRPIGFEQRVSKLEFISVEMTQSKEHRENIFKKLKCHSSAWDNVKKSNIGDRNKCT